MSFGKTNQQNMSTEIPLASLKRGGGMPENQVGSVAKMLRIF